MIISYYIGRGRNNSRPKDRVSPNLFSCPSLFLSMRLICVHNSSKTAIRFIADDQSLFVSGLGLLMDGTGALGGPRAKVTNTSISLALILTHVTCVSFYTALRHYRNRRNHRYRNCGGKRGRVNQHGGLKGSVVSLRDKPFCRIICQCRFELVEKRNVLMKCTLKIECKTNRIG
jgi:hypothetical protein